MSSTPLPHLSTAWCLAPVLAVSLAVLGGCGGSVGSDSDGDGLDTADGGEVGSGGAHAAGGRPGAAGAASSGGVQVASGGAQIASGGARPTPDGGVPVCPIRESGTLLTDEADCYACIRPGAPCETRPNVASLQLTPEVCVNVVRSGGTIYCMWLADGDPFDQPWGAVTICDSNPGQIACGGGI